MVGFFVFYLKMSDRAEYDGDMNEDVVSEVCMSGLVALKIIKHCKENMPELVTGYLFFLSFFLFSLSLSFSFSFFFHSSLQLVSSCV